LLITEEISWSCLEEAKIPPPPTDIEEKNQRLGWDWKEEAFMTEKY